MSAPFFALNTPDNKPIRLDATNWNEAIGEALLHIMPLTGGNVQFGLRTRTQMPVFINRKMFVIRMVG